MSTHLFPLLDTTYTVSSLTTADSNYKEGKISITFALATQLVFLSNSIYRQQPKDDHNKCDCTCNHCTSRGAHGNNSCIGNCTGLLNLKKIKYGQEHSKPKVNTILGYQIPHTLSLVLQQQTLIIRKVKLVLLLHQQLSLFSSAIPYTDSSLRMIITSVIVPATIVLVVVLMGIILVLGIVLVYLISKKSNTVKNTANQRLIPYQVKPYSLLDFSNDILFYTEVMFP